MCVCAQGWWRFAVTALIKNHIMLILQCSVCVCFDKLLFLLTRSLAMNLAVTEVKRPCLFTALC